MVLCSSLKNTFINDSNICGLYFKNRMLIQFCEYDGGSLAEIIDEHNQKAIEMFLEAVDPSGEYRYWIGLTDIFHEGTFIWATTGEKATYFNWISGQPDNRNNGTEHFVDIVSTPNGREWNDCSNDCGMSVRGICQFTL